MKKYLLGIIFASISSLILLSGWACYEGAREAAFICIPLIAPSLPFMGFADLLRIPYDGPMNWPLITVGSAVIWFLTGAGIQKVHENQKNKK